MRERHHFAITDEQRNIITAEVRDVARLMGCDLPDNHIDFCGLSQSTYTKDALILGEDGKSQRIVEFPLSSDDALQVNPTLYGEVIKHILNTKAEYLRAQCFQWDPDAHAHCDASMNIIWNDLIGQIHPGRVCSYSSTAYAVDSIVSWDTPHGAVSVGKNSITIPHELPASISATASRMRLRDVLELPFCGCQKTQEAFLDQSISSAVQVGSATRIDLLALTYPMRDHEGVYPWRKMKKYALKFYPLILSADPIKYDRENDIVAARAYLEQFMETNGSPRDWYKPQAQAA